MELIANNIVTMPNACYNIANKRQCLGGGNMKVSTTDLQNSFGKYLALVDKDDVIITKNGRSVAKLIPYSEPDRYILNEEHAQYVSKRQISYEEYLDLVENTEQRYELIDGEIYLMASPLFQHQVTVNEIYVHLYNWFKGKPCRPLTSPFDVKLFGHATKFDENPNVVQPDILIMCDEDKITEKGKYEGIPTLVVEALSKSTKSKDMVKKLNLYMTSGVEEYWIVNTDEKLIYQYTFLEREIHKYTVYTSDTDIASEAFQGLTIALEDIFTW